MNMILTLLPLGSLIFFSCQLNQNTRGVSIAWINAIHIRDTSFVEQDAKTLFLELSVSNKSDSAILLYDIFRRIDGYNALLVDTCGNKLALLAPRRPRKVHIIDYDLIIQPLEIDTFQFAVFGFVKFLDE